MFETVSDGACVVATRYFESGPPPSKLQLATPEDAEVFETVKEEEWVTKKKTTTTTKKNVEKRIQRHLLLEDGEVVGDTGPLVSEDKTEDVVTNETVADEKLTPEGQGDEPLEEQGWVKVGGEIVVSEKTHRTVNSHQVSEDAEETEEVTHCGDVTNQEVDNFVCGKSDLKKIKENRGWEVAKPEKRTVNQWSKKWGTVDTEDVRETSRVQDDHVITETEKTTQHEEYDNKSEPDSGSSLSDGSAHEEVKETQHNIVHTKDEDFVEFYAVPKGGTLAEGVKLGEGMHVVSEDFHEDKQGNDIPERIKRSKKLTKDTAADRFDALTQKPLNYQEEEETRKKETNKWLEHHFGSDSSRSRGSSNDLSEEVESSFHKTGGNRITITMSPRPATPEDIVDAPMSSNLKRWGNTNPIATSTPTKINISQSISKSYTSSHPPPPPPLPSAQNEIQDFNLVAARARLRSTGRLLIDDDVQSGSNTSQQNETKYEIKPDRYKVHSPSPKYTTISSPTSTGYSSGSHWKSSLDDDPVYNSRFRSGSSSEGGTKHVSSYKYSPTQNFPPTTNTNVGRSQSFNVTPKSWFGSRLFRSHSPSRKSNISGYKSEDHLDIVGRTKHSLAKRLSKMWPPSPRGSSPETRDPSPPPRNTRKPSKKFTFDLQFPAKEAATQTGPSPIPPPRTKKKGRPHSMYYFGQESPQTKNFTKSTFVGVDKENVYRGMTNYQDTGTFSSINISKRDNSPVIERKFKTTKTITPIVTVPMREQNYLKEKTDRVKSWHFDGSDGVPKKSWTSTLDPRRRLRDNDDDLSRPTTLPRKSGTNAYSPLNKKTYYFGESDSSSGYKTPSIRNTQGGSMLNVSLSNRASAYEGHLIKKPEYKASTLGKPVGRSQSFNVQPISEKRIRGSDKKERTENSMYQSSPYLNLRSPNLIANIARTNSMNLHDSHNDDTSPFKSESPPCEMHEEKKARFLKGLLETAPELYRFMHGSDSQRDKRVPTNDAAVSANTYMSGGSAASASPTVGNHHRVFTFGREAASHRPATVNISNETKQGDSTRTNQGYGNKRRSTFNLKTEGGSLLYSPSFRTRQESEPAPWEKRSSQEDPWHKNIH